MVTVILALNLTLTGCLNVQVKIQEFPPQEDGGTIERLENSRNNNGAPILQNSGNQREPDTLPKQIHLPTGWTVLRAEIIGTRINPKTAQVETLQSFNTNRRDPHAGSRTETPYQPVPKTPYAESKSLRTQDRGEGADPLPRQWRNLQENRNIQDQMLRREQWRKP
ncbi:MAG: hypothetical protein [Microvirus sp.]|nr:MAG: hypothetical protein [Microvirus sp.]